MSPCSPWSTTVEQGFTLQPVEETTVEQVALHQWRLPPVEDPCRSRFRAGPVACGEETTQEQVTWQELLPMGEPGWSSLLLRDGPHGTDPYLEQFWKSCCLWEAHAGSVHQGLHPMGGTLQHRGQE